MAEGRSILLLEGGDGCMQALAHRLRLLHFHVLRAKTPEEAVRMAEDRRYAIGAVLLPPVLPVADLPRALAALRERAAEGELSYVGVGPEPEPSVLEALRAADVRLALWEPFDDGRLRFQVNRALAGGRGVAPRNEIRVPVELPAQVWSRGRRKTATVYTLSAAGTFLETPRPTVTGASVAIELPLGAGGVDVKGRVVYTNVPGNLRKRNLPVGMAVAFTTMQDEAEAAIRHRVAQTAFALVI